MAEHPSVFITEELEARGWSVADLLARMSDRHINENALGLALYSLVGPAEPNMRLGEAMAIELAQAFGVSDRLFLNLEQAWLKSLEPE